MRNRISLIAIMILSLVTTTAQAARWDIAFDGGFVRCNVDINAENSTVAAKLYYTAPGGDVIIAENMVLANYDENYVIQGTITTGTFHVGLGSLQFTVGDRFYLFVSKYTEEVLLLLVHDSSTYWVRKLHYF